MKHFLFILFLFYFSLNGSAQNFRLKIIGSSTIENKVIDSLKNNLIYPNVKSISDEINTITKNLSKLGYTEAKVIENKKENDTTFITKINLGERIKSIHIYIDSKTSLFTPIKTSEINTTNSNAILFGNLKPNDTLIIPYQEVESFLESSLKKLEQSGFALAKLKLINIHKKKDILYAELHLESNQIRVLNSIVIKSLDNEKKNSFPKGHLKQVNQKYKNTTFNQNVVEKIYQNFNEFKFVNQIKYPEILFTKDTTKVYVYLEKKASNTFDGIIGFTNDKNDKLIFNGYLDLTLENTLKVGEQFSLYWKSDGNNQKTFKTSLEIPYLFKSPVGLKTEIQIFKQDSIYQNTNTSLYLGYTINYNTRLYLGYQSTESSDILNSQSNTINDFKNSFITPNLEYSKYETSNSFFLKKTNLSITIGFGKRTTSSSVENNKQTYIQINAMNNFYLNKKNCFNINYQNYFLKSDTYITNELFRFGGIKSIRGFAENSLQANSLNALITEYRYIFSPDLYIHSILDYGYYEDKTTQNREKILGIGFGLGIKTKTGLLKIIFSNGTIKTENIKLSNTILNLCYNAKF